MNGGSGNPAELAFPLVLVCEDRRLELEELEAMLQRHGFRTDGSTTFEEAETKLRNNHYAAVVADFHLPAGRDGSRRDGVHLLEVARDVSPLSVRILFTADPMGATLAELVGGVWISKGADYAIAVVRAIREGLER